MALKIRITTGLFLLVVIFTVLQLISSVASFKQAKSSFGDFEATMVLNEQHDYLVKFWVTLLHTQIQLNQSAFYIGSNQAEKGTEILLNTQKTLASTQENFMRFVNANGVSDAPLELTNSIKTQLDTLFLEIAKQIELIKNDSIAQVELREIFKKQNELEITMQHFADNVDKQVGAKTASNEQQYKLAFLQLVIVILLALSVTLYSLFWIRQTVKKPLEQLLEHFEHIADGDLTQHVKNSSSNEIGKLLDYFSKMQQYLINTVTAVRDSTHDMVDGVEHIVDQNKILLESTHHQSDVLQKTLTSIDELTSAVKKNTHNAHSASGLAQKATSTARVGGQLTQTVVDTMHKISESSHKITAITSVIDGIAFQTNILALNAAVEAARAGEQGRGFAVVAGEVRNLAQRSAQAAKEIKELIEASLHLTQEGAGVVETAGENMQEIVASIVSVTEIIGNISNDSDEQSDKIETVSASLNEVEQVSNRNTALINQLSESTLRLEEQAEELSKAVSMFTLEKTHSYNDA